MRLAYIATVLALAVVAGSVAADETPPATSMPAGDAPPAEAAAELDEHRAQPESAEEAVAEPTPNAPFDLRLYWKHGLNYVALRRLHLERADRPAFDRRSGSTVESVSRRPAAFGRRSLRADTTSAHAAKGPGLLVQTPPSRPGTGACRGGPGRRGAPRRGTSISSLEVWCAVH
jgi:hypothetical protein